MLDMQKMLKVISFFLIIIEANDKNVLYQEISNDYIKRVMQYFQKDIRSGSHGYPIELFLEIFELVEEDILRMVEGKRLKGKISRCLNSMFLALISNQYNMRSLNDFNPIDLCNCAYKIVSKIMEARIKPFLDQYISPYQFSFLEGR